MGETRERVRVISTVDDRAAHLIWLLFLTVLVVSALNLAAAAQTQAWMRMVVALVMMAFCAGQAVLWRGARVSRLAVSDEGLYRLAGGPASAATGWQASWDQITEARVQHGSAGPVLVVRVKNPPRLHQSRWFVSGLTRAAKDGAYLCQLDPAAVAAVRQELARRL